MPSFSSNGLQLHYEDLGTGEPVVLLHGFTSSFAGTWERTGWVALLTSGDRRVIGLDFPSHGDSDPVDEPKRCSPGALASDVVALLDYLRLEQVDVVGFSLGAGIALRIAMAQPKRVRRLIVGGIGDAAIVELHDPNQVATIAAAFAVEGGDDVSNPVARRIRQNAELGGQDPSVLLPFLQGVGWPGSLDRLGPISAPTLLFKAGHDQYMGATEAIERWLTPAKVIQLDDHDHHSILRDRELQRRVRRWLSRPAHDSNVSAGQPGSDAATLKIRRYAATDEEMVWRLHSAGLDQFGANAGEGPWDDDLRHIEEAYLRDGEFLVGEVGDEVVAMGALRAVAPEVGEVKRVRVAHPFQRRGIGEAISKALLERAEELGFRRVILDTTTRQVPAQRLYEKLGFQETHRKLGHTGLELIFYERRVR